MGGAGHPLDSDKSMTKQGVLTTAIHSDIILSRAKNGINIDLLGGNYDSESSWQGGCSDRQHRIHWINLRGGGGVVQTFGYFTS